MKKISLRTIDGFRLSGVFSKGSSESVIIWLHGISVDRDEYLGFFRETAEALAGDGYSSLRFDFRGHGRSSGNRLDFSVVGQTLDSDAAISFAGKRSDSSRLAIHLVAASFGAPPAIYCAIRYPKLVRSVALIAPVLSYERTFLDPETEWAKEIFNPASMERMRRTGKVYFDKKFFIGARLVEEMRLLRPDLALADVRQPVLVIHGDRDSMVPYSATKAICDDLRAVRLVTLAGADHGHVAEGDEEGKTKASRENLEAITELLREHLRC